MYTWLRCDEDNIESIQFADINGDGLADLCYRADQGIVCWKNRGTSAREAGSSYMRWANPVITNYCTDGSTGLGECDGDNNYSSIDRKSVV